MPSTMNLVSEIYSFHGVKFLKSAYQEKKKEKIIIRRKTKKRKSYKIKQIVGSEYKLCYLHGNFQIAASLFQ